MKQIIIIVATLLIAFFAYIYLQPKLFDNDVITSSVSTDNLANSTDEVVFSKEELADIPPTYNDSVPMPITEPVQSTTQAQAFVCDGRQHCSQMTSCAEATYFSNSCPNTKMDGNNDGIPCEQQWCN